MPFEPVVTTASAYAYRQFFEGIGPLIGAAC